MKNRRNLAITAAIACALSAPLAIGPSAAQADELSDLRANQQLLQQRLDQLAQAIPSEGKLYPGGPPSAAAGKGIIGGSFPRSFLIPGTDTSIRVGGAIREVFDYWFNGGNPNASPQSTTVGDNGQVLAAPLNIHPHQVGGALVFPPGTSAASGVARARSAGIFLQSPRESKMNVETRTPTAWGEARTFMEFDWAGSTSFAPGGANVTSVSDNLHPRLRFAYGTLGGFLAGQANSNFSDPDGNSQTIDFGGNVGEAGVVRVPQVRYTMPLAPWGFLGALSVSAETPETDGWTLGGQIASDGSPISITPGAPFFNPFKAPAPDLTMAWFVPQPWGHFDASAVLRPALEIKDGAFVSRTYTGWGVHLGFDVKPGWFGWAKDDILMQATGGIGIGRYLNCSCSIALMTNYPAAGPFGAGGFGGAGGVSPATFLSRLTPAFGGEIGYQHWWAPNLWSNINSGFYHQDLATFPGGAVPVPVAARNGLNKELVTAHVNLLWSPVPFVTTGIEYMYGHRIVVTNLKGDENVLIGKFEVSF